MVTMTETDTNTTPETPDEPAKPRWVPPFKVHDYVICTNIQHPMFGRLGRIVKPESALIPGVMNVVFEAESLSYRSATYDMPLTELRKADTARQNIEVPPVEEMDKVHTIFQDLLFELSEEFALDWVEIEAAWLRSKEIIKKQYPEADPIKRKELERTLFLWRMKLILGHHIGIAVERAMGEKTIPPVPPHVVWS